ncbi:MAG: histidine kinase [Bacteroidaceae bacterium]|nr:histidine kinase [Bacteroidaceae bacterium]
MWTRHQSKNENIVYAVLWGLLFAAPVLTLYVRTAGNAQMAFSWDEVMTVWRLFAIYLGLFLIHNFLLAPLLIHKRRQWSYAVCVALILGTFAMCQHNSKPEIVEPLPREAMKYRMPFHDRKGDFRPAPPDGHRPPEARPHRPPMFFDEHGIVAIVVLLLMVGANLGTKYYFRSRNDRKRLQELEKQNLEQQLEYLRYQINPHFFMNTLNNIHALVDIHPEKAKDTIVELSKMMRYVLYEGNRNGVALARELDFIRHYITLMKLRFTDKVKITLSLPTETPDKQIPPLILVTFIENAFKHGISYQRDSFIDIGITVTDRLTFTCRNSKADKPNDEKGGVGLQNVKQRLQLLYDGNFTLNIKDEADTYNVELIIPLT